jgi:hypothetical protein
MRDQGVYHGVGGMNVTNSVSNGSGRQHSPDLKVLVAALKIGKNLAAHPEQE